MAIACSPASVVPLRVPIVFAPPPSVEGAHSFVDRVRVRAPSRTEREQKMTIQPQSTRAVPSAELSAQLSGPSTRRASRRPPEMVPTGPYATTYALPHLVRASSSREDSGGRTNIETRYVVHPDIAMQRPTQLTKAASKAAMLAIDQSRRVTTDGCTDVPKATTRVRKNSAELDMPPRLTRQRTGDTPLLMLATPPPVQRTGLSKDMGAVSVTPPTATGVDTRICSELEARGPVALPPEPLLNPAPSTRPLSCTQRPSTGPSSPCPSSY